MATKKYRIAPSRAQWWDYGINAAYFITICTKNHKHEFGRVRNGKMQLNDAGNIADHFWKEIPSHFPFVKLEEYVIMPNHIHGIVVIEKIDENTTTENKDNGIPGKLRFRNPGKNNISSIIGGYKSVVSKSIHEIHSDFMWQSRFHDKIIRNERMHKAIRNYIINNESNWKED